MSVVSRTSRRHTVPAIVPPHRPQLRVPSDTPQAEQNPPVPTFSEFLVGFRQDFSGWSPVTWRGLSGVLRNLEAEFGEVSLDKITARGKPRA